MNQKLTIEFKAFGQLDKQLTEFAWFGETFLKTKGGITWDALPGRNYFATPWMEFYGGIHDGTYCRLADAIAESQKATPCWETIQARLKPLLTALATESMERGQRKIPVHIDKEKFGRYVIALRQLSTDGILSDTVSAEGNTRKSYFIDSKPFLTRSYLMQGITHVLERCNPGELKRNQEQESVIHKLESELTEKKALLAVLESKISDLNRTADEQRDGLNALTTQNRRLKETLAKYHMEDENLESGETDESGPIKDGKLRMYFLYKLGFLDHAIWTEKTNYGQRARILGKILGGGPIAHGTILRYYKLFNGTGSPQLRDYEAENERKIRRYLEKTCPGADFPKGTFINTIRRC